MAKTDRDLFDTLRARGLRKSAANNLARAFGRADNSPPSKGAKRALRLKAQQEVKFFTLASGMRGFVSHQPGAYDWGEINARNVEGLLPFFEKVFGWQVKTSEPTPGQPPYHEFTLEGESILGAWEMNPMVPADVPTYWQIYFNVGDVDGQAERAKALGATELVASQDIPGGRFAILRDPQGASFGLLHFEAPDNI